MLLAEKSLFFRNLFSSPLQCQNEVFLLKNVSLDALQRAIDYMTDSSTNLNEENVLEMLSLSVYLAIPSLQQKCQDHLEAIADPQDYCMILSFAKENYLDDFRSKMCKLILKRGAEIFTGESFVDLDITQMCELIGSHDLMIGAEELCWFAVRKWYMHDKVNRMEGLQGLLELVRFALIEETKLTALLSSTEDSFLKTHLRRAIYRALILLRKDAPRSFEVSHPKYHLRNQSFKEGLLAVNGSNVVRIQSMNMNGTVGWYPPDSKDMIGIFDPSTNETEWLWQVPECLGTRFVAQSSTGDLFFASSWVNDSHSSGKLYKYSVDIDTWDLITEDGIHWFRGMCILGDWLYIFYVNDTYAPTFMKRWNFRATPASNISDLDVSLPFNMSVKSPVIPANGLIFVFQCPPVGGDVAGLERRRTFCFNPATGNWKRLSDCPVQLSMRGGMCLHPNGLIYFTSTDMYPTDREYQVKLRAYDPSQDTWMILTKFHRKFYPLEVSTWAMHLVVIFRVDWRGLNEDAAVTHTDWLIPCTHGSSCPPDKLCQDHVVKIYDPEKNVWISSSAVTRRDTGCAATGFTSKFRKSVLKKSMQDVETLKLGRPQVNDRTLEELTAMVIAGTYP